MLTYSLSLRIQNQLDRQQWHHPTQKHAQDKRNNRSGCQDYFHVVGLRVNFFILLFLCFLNVSLVIRQVRIMIKTLNSNFLLTSFICEHIQFHSLQNLHWPLRLKEWEVFSLSCTVWLFYLTRKYIALGNCVAKHWVLIWVELFKMKTGHIMPMLGFEGQSSKENQTLFILPVLYQDHFSVLKRHSHCMKYKQRRLLIWQFPQITWEYHVNNIPWSLPIQCCGFGNPS